MNSTVHKKIYKTVLDVLSGGAVSHKKLIEDVIVKLYGDVPNAGGPVGEFTAIRGLVGSVIAEMKRGGVIFEEEGLCTSGEITPMAIRMESCEAEILSLLSSAPKTKQQIRSHLVNVYRTNETPSKQDDALLFNYIGQILRKLIAEQTVLLEDGRYSLCKETKANIDDINSMLKLKSAFISRIHHKGGEFFEHYIMTLLEKHQTKYGKTVVECRTTGGSSDGGIDGIIKTIDPLGFKETTMIQAKNRTDITTETVVRGFYGAVCALGGSRGIFATTSDFHPSAKIFLTGIDNCVGINGDDIFNMACECLWGIRKKSGELVIDNKIL